MSAADGYVVFGKAGSQVHAVKLPFRPGFQTLQVPLIGRNACGRIVKQKRKRIAGVPRQQRAFFP